LIATDRTRAGGAALAGAYPLGYRHVGRMLFCPRGRTFSQVSLSPAGEDDRHLDKTLHTAFGDVLTGLQGITRDGPWTRRNSYSVDGPVAGRSG
jgi:hypothetical protein